MHQETKCCIQPLTNPPSLDLRFRLSFAFFFVWSNQERWFKTSSIVHVKSFQASNDSYLFQDASEPLGLTVNDNLSLLPLVQILEHFQERGLSHGLHVHGGHQPIPLCCRIQNLL